MASQKYMSTLQLSLEPAYRSGNSVHLKTSGRVARRITRPRQSRCFTRLAPGGGSDAARCATRAASAASLTIAIPPPYALSGLNVWKLKIQFGPAITVEINSTNAAQRVRAADDVGAPRGRQPDANDPWLMRVDRDVIAAAIGIQVGEQPA